MKIKCQSCGKIYETDVDELCPKCGAYNSFDRGVCTHYEGEDYEVERGSQKECPHSEMPQYIPEEYEPEAYEPAIKKDKNRKRKSVVADTGARPKKSKMTAIIVVMLLFSVFAPTAAEWLVDQVGEAVSSAPEEPYFAEMAPEEVFVVEERFLLSNWQAQRVFLPDGNSYIYVSVQAETAEGYAWASSRNIEPYMESGGEFWRPTQDYETLVLMEAVGCAPYSWGLSFVEEVAQVYGFVFPDLGEDTIKICVADATYGTFDVRVSENLIWCVSIPITEEANSNDTFAR